jgi:hypothetical protein
MNMPRLFRPRLELTISGRAVQARAPLAKQCLYFCPAQKRGPLKGRDFKKKVPRSGLATDPTKTDGAAEWQRTIAIGAFERHGRIEPGRDHFERRH